jgi:hypothetical protein
MQDFHAGTRAVYENEYITILNITPHLVGHNATECIKAASHVCRMGIQVILHRGGKAEHATGVLKPATSEASLHPGTRLLLWWFHWESLLRRISVWCRYPDKETDPFSRAVMPAFGSLVARDQ